MRVGIIGTGMLGTAVGLHLLESGMELITFNRTKEKTKELSLKGATVVESPKDVSKACNLVITCVRDAKAVRDVSFGENSITHGLHEKLVVADMSTINPLDSKQIAEEFQTKGITWLDTPVMGGPNVAIKGELVMMASGDETAFLEHEKIFKTIASKRFFLGKSGNAHSVKLAMNLQIALLALAISEGITLARGASVDPEIFLKILNSTYFKTGMSQNKAYKMIKDEFQPTFTLQNLTKDLTTINEAAKSFGLSLPMSLKAEKTFQKAIEAGFGDLDYTGILAYLKNITKSENAQN